MIIKYPTGLYQDAGQLPIKESDSGNVTFTISNEIPKRATSPTVQLTAAEELKPLPLPDYAFEDRRELYGELIYTLIDGNESATPTGKKLFSIGQVLEFDEEEFDIPDSVNIPYVDVQHNTNIMNYDDAGLSEDDVTLITSNAMVRKSELENEIAAAQSLLYDLQTGISENQKTLNEVNKIISAVQSLPNSTDILNKLKLKQEELIQSRSELTDQYNAKTIELNDLFDQMLKISEIVK